MKSSRVMEVLGGLSQGMAGAISEHEINFLSEKALIKVLSNDEYEKKRDEVGKLAELETKLTNLQLDAKKEVEINFQLTVRLVSFWSKIWMILRHGYEELQRLREKVKVDRRKTLKKIMQCGGLHNRIKQLQESKKELDPFVQAGYSFLAPSDAGLAVLEALTARKDWLEGMHFEDFAYELNLEREAVRVRYEKFSDTFFLLRQMKLDFLGGYLASLAFDISCSNGHARTLCERAYTFSRLFAMEGWTDASYFNAISVLLTKRGDPETITDRLKEAYLSKVEEGAPQNCTTLRELAHLDDLAPTDAALLREDPRCLERIGELEENAFHTELVRKVIEGQSFGKFMDVDRLASQIVGSALLDLQDNASVSRWNMGEERAQKQQG